MPAEAATRNTGDTEAEVVVLRAFAAQLVEERRHADVLGLVPAPMDAPMSRRVMRPRLSSFFSDVSTVLS